MSFYTPEITLIEKNSVSVTPVAIKGDSTMGNLTEYRQSAIYNDTINEITKNGQITLRSSFGLFDTKGPILTDEYTKTKYLIQVQLKQGTREGQLFRFEISGTLDNESKGKHITLLLTGYDIRTEEFLDSENLQLVTPKQSFSQRIINFLTGRDLSSIGSIKITYVDAQNLLPDDERLKQDWFPTEPLTTKKLLSEIIRRTSTPTEIGSTNEDWYYNIVPQSDTESFRVFVDRLGAVSSGVELDVFSEGVRVASSEINKNFDNTKYKNGLIVKGAKGKHTFPMDFTRHASDFTHASISSVWSIGKLYLKGDYVKFGNKYYKCLQKNNANAANLPVNVVYWYNLSDTTIGSPWTIDTNLWLANMVGSENPPTGIVGYFNDMNIERRLYDRDDEFNEFETVSVKDVEMFLTSPNDIPSGQKQHGRRWLVDNGAETDWQGHANQIAQWDESVSPAVWRYSKSPVEGDIVNLLNPTPSVLGFNGTIWDIIWSLNVHPERSSPFFPVKSIAKIADRNNLSKAIEFTFDWNIFDAEDITDTVFDLAKYLSYEFKILSMFGESLKSLTPITVASFLLDLNLTKAGIIDELGVGNVKNKASRRYGFNIKAPFPRRDITGNPQGSQIKKSTMDFVNLNESMKSGKKSWNEGIHSEDLGNIRGVEIWVKLLHRTKSGAEVNGIANSPQIFWFRDLTGRIIYHTPTIRAHNAWQKLVIPAGFGSKLTLYDSRIDELWTLFDYTFPFNHFIKERELTGVSFDWRNVIEMGMFNKESYDDNFLYKAGQNSHLDTFIEHAIQSYKNLAVYTGGIIEVEKSITDNVKFAISDIHLLKDAFVTTSNSKISSPRIALYNQTNQWDYVNLQGIGKRKLSRLQYHPERRVINSRGDVDIKAGQSLTLKGMFGEKETLSITSVSHIEDGLGYHCETKTIKKYEPGV